MTDVKKQSFFSVEVEAIFFDLDGTLVDTVPLIIASHRHTFNKYLGWIPDESTLLSTIGVPLEKTFKEYGKDLAYEMLDEYLIWSTPRMSEMVDIFPGVVETLAELKSRGFILGIVTSRRRAGVDVLMEKYDLEHYFSVCVSVNDPERPKPYPDPLYLAMRQTCISDPSHVLYVGDSVHDVHCANNAGTMSCVVGWTAMDKEELGALNPTFWIDRMEDLLERVELCSPRSES
ncbi:MAG: HAD-IA family hydrolase [Clostridiaceae bacterium]|jgi:pyrophosphatase PpaX|nr:HAD-IA family hydrolase [Clostridiaceae bacterium]